MVRSHAPLQGFFFDGLIPWFVAQEAIVSILKLGLQGRQFFLNKKLRNCRVYVR